LVERGWLKVFARIKLSPVDFAMTFGGWYEKGDLGDPALVLHLSK
jgi:hypothetical protein